MKEQDQLRYPIGKFEYGKKYSTDQTRKNIKIIEQLPKELKKLLKKATKEQLDTPYRPDGWTVRQVVHHLADSHMNAYIRTKLAVTEKGPIIKPYEEKDWAETLDGKSSPVKTSLKLLSALTTRWITFLSSLSDDDLEKGFHHPVSKRYIIIPELMALYAWHSQHHLGHIRLVIGSAKASDSSEAKATSSEAPAAAPKAKGKAGRPAKAAAPKADTPKVAGKRGRPAKAASATATEAVAAPKAKGKAGRPAKAAAPKADTPKVAGKRGRPANPNKPAKPVNDGPKLTKQEIMAKARATRMANLAAAGKTPKPKPVNDGPKLSKEEVMAKARAARMANLAAAGKTPKAKPVNDGPKMTKQEALAKAREARKKKG
jgi:DinB superfamily/AT hook motif